MQAERLSPYPSIYCPAGLPRPAHCPHVHCFELRDGVQGPDGVAGGRVYGARPFDPRDAGDWQRTADGWWVNLAGVQPQHLRRVDTCPRVLRWRDVSGTRTGDWWRIPVLLELLDAEQPERGWISALDRVWTGDRFVAGDAGLASLQERLLCLACDTPLAEGGVEARNAALVALAIDLLAVGHHVSAGEIYAAGWLSERLLQQVPMAALDMETADAG